MNRKLRFGMIGGGRGAFIGAVHRIAAQMDGQAELVAGAFSANAAKSRASGADLFLAPARVYGSYEEMAVSESGRALEERLDFVVIVTPNDGHFPVAKLFLEKGFHVICDKPVTLNLLQARALQKIVERTQRIFVLTHNYTGHVMVKQARALVHRGVLGEVRKVLVEYPQGWLSSALENTGHKQAEWRTDPKRSGAGGALGDIATHALHLALYVSQLRVHELCADLSTFVTGRRLDDDNNVLLRFQGGAKGILHSSQISVGDENGLSLRVMGTKAALEWHQENPSELIVKHPDRPREVWKRGNAYLDPAAARFSRIPPGHPEGYLEAFGNIYLEAFRAIRAAGRKGQKLAAYDFPTIADGVLGMNFIACAVRSSRANSRWIKLAT